MVGTPQKGGSKKAARQQWTATPEDPIKSLQKALETLEHGLAEVESAAQVIQFDGLVLSTEVKSRAFDPHAAQKKTNLQLTPNGATQLATEVADELKVWRKRREDAYTQRQHARDRRWQEALAAKRQEEEDRKHVRASLRDMLFAEASNVFAKHRDKIPASPRYPAALTSSSSPGADELSSWSVTPGADALANLRERLEVCVQELESVKPEPPLAMTRASAMATDALEKKRERHRQQEQRQRFTDGVGKSDEALVEEAEDGLIKRQNADKAHLSRMKSVLSIMKQCVDDRFNSFEKLNHVNQAGPADLEPGTWKALGPENRQDTALGELVGSTKERTAISQEVKNWGQRKIDEISASFYQRYASKDKSQQKALAEAKLEEWRLSTRLKLLEEIQQTANYVHQKGLSKLQSMQEYCGVPELSSAEAAGVLAERFMRTKADVFRVEGENAEGGIRRHLTQRLEPLQQMRRRAETMALKRQANADEQIEAMAKDAEYSSLLQIVEAAKGLLRACHTALPLPPITTGSAASVETLKSCPRFLGWERLSTPMAERLAETAQFLESLPSTAETCALEKGLL